jgi:ribosomal subunit interface protein
MEIHWHNASEIDAALHAKVDEQLERLASHHRDLIDIHVDVERRSEHHRSGARRVEIRCQARGATLVAHGSNDNLSVAMHAALRDFRREVQRMRERRRDARSIQPAAPPLRGIVDEVVRSEGYGFLITESGERVYFHRNAVGAGLDFERLEDGDEVALDCEAGAAGLQATYVKPLGTS